MIFAWILPFAVCVRTIPAFAHIAWRVARLHSSLLSRLTSRIPFPCAECLCIALCAALVCAPKLRKYILLWLLAGYFVLWYPAYRMPVTDVPALNAEELYSVCAALISDAEVIPECVPLEQIVRECNVKLARFPEWMRFCRLAGIFIPHTAEVILSPDFDAYAAAFTACHELQHAAGIADEGEANLRAYAVCMEKGGIYAFSAKLWHLQYSMQKLHQADADAWCNLRDSMSPALYAIFQNSIHGFSEAEYADNLLFRFLGIADAVRDYDRLAYQKQPDRIVAAMRRDGTAYPYHVQMLQSHALAHNFRKYFHQ